MNVRNSSVFGSALGGFTIGTIVALAYVCSGASFVLLTQGWARVALFPGFVVGYHTFDVVGYSTAISLACLTVGFAYSMVATAAAGVLRTLRLRTSD